jgi:uncharacterized RDD family membrane protein YckC
VTAGAPAVVVGFWRRVLADLLDAIVLGGVGWGLGYPFRYALSELGGHAAWIGLVVSLLYAGVLQTRTGGGQTLGKRAVGIQVLRRDGRYLSYARSLIRHVVVSFVFYNGMYGSLFAFVSPPLARVLGTVFLLAVLWAFFACFLMIPMHPLKRGLHDLVSDSVVVYKGRYDAAVLETLEDPRRARRALGLVALLTALVLCAFLWALHNVGRQQLTRLSALQHELAKDYTVTRINDVTFNGKHRTLHVEIWLPLRQYEDKAERERIRAAVLARTRASVPAIADFERVRVRVASGFNVGIARVGMND